MQTLNIVCNSSPLIHLYKVNQLDLIARLYQQIAIPYAVYDELVLQDSGKPGSKAIEDLVQKDIIQVKNAQNKPLLIALQSQLDYGESETIALAVELKADLVILDEVEARKMAERYQLNKTGFLGIILKAQKENVITNAKAIIEQAIQNGFWISPSLYQQIMQNL